MSALKEMSEKTIRKHLFEVFQKIEKQNIKVSYLIISPEDWVYIRTIPQLFNPSDDKGLFEKGHCGDMWGAEIWISKEATEIKAYADSDTLKKDYPNLT